MPQTLVPSLSPKSNPGFISPGSVLNPHMLFGHPVRDGRASQKKAGEKMRRRERENTGDRGVERIKQEGIRVPLHTHTKKTPNPNPAQHTDACPAHSVPPACPPGPHPDLVPELLSLLSQLLQLTHGAGPVGRDWGRLGGRGTGAGGGSSSPLARGLGDAGLTSGPRSQGRRDRWG